MTSRRQFTRQLLIGGALGALTTGCDDEPPPAREPVLEGADRYASVTIRYADPGNSGIFAFGKREGIFARELARVNARIEWVPAFGAFSASFDAMNSGAINASSAAISPVIGALSRNLRFKVFSISDPGATRIAGILAPRGSGLRTVRDLIGKRVAVNLGAHGDYVLLKALANEGIPAELVTRVPIQPPDAASAFAAGQIDAWSIFGVYYTTAVRNGAHVIVREEQIGSDDVGVIAANVRLLERNPTAFGVFVRVAQELVEQARRQPERFQNVFTTRGPTAVTGDELRIAIEEMRVYPSPRLVTPADRQRIRNVSKILYENRSLDREITVDEIVHDIGPALATLETRSGGAR